MRSFFTFAPIVALIFGASAAPARAADLPSPERLVQQSISHHDPSGVWGRGKIHLRIRVEYSAELAERWGKEKAQREIWLAPSQGTFRFLEGTGEDLIEYRLDQGKGTVAVNGQEEIPEAERERLRISTPERYRDYFEYLLGMPMKLRDPGTRLHPEVVSARFDGRRVWELRVTYDPEVGEDVWYFYFSPEDARLVGYRFFHEEAENDGETIVLADEIRDEATGLRLPRTMAWYTNATGSHLATDAITELEVEMPDD